MRYRPITAIAGQTLRGASRSRVVLALFVLLGATLVILPLTIRGDGTLEGWLRILLHYMLGLSGLLLTITTIWCASSSISRDVELRYLHLILVKPIRRTELWLGRWLGLLILNAVWLTAAGVLVLCMVNWRFQRPDISPAQRQLIERDLLTSHRPVFPRAEPVHEEAEQLLESMLKVQSPTNITADQRSQVLSELENRLLARRATVAPGRTREWVIDVPASIRSRSKEVRLRFHLTPTVLSDSRVHGFWRISLPGSTPLVLQHRPLSGGSQVLAFPVSSFPPGESVSIVFSNQVKSLSATAMFEPNGPVELLIHTGSFAGNLARVLLVMLAGLTVVAALGLCMSSIFSSPVATFSACALLIIGLVGQYVATSTLADPHHDHGHDHGSALSSSAWSAAGERVADLLSHVVGPMLQFRSLQKLSDGLEVTLHDVLRAIALLMLFIPGLLCAISAVVLRHREIARFTG